jgi:hypothetical protein
MTAIFGTPIAAVLLAVELLLFEWRRAASSRSSRPRHRGGAGAAAVRDRPAVPLRRR